MDRPAHAAQRPPRGLTIRHYSRRTEAAYVGWVRRYILFHGIRHPDELGNVEGVEFLSDLAVSGMRLIECLRLRVKDIDFERHQITEREGKGRRDRATRLPRAAAPMLHDQLAASWCLFDADRANGAPGVCVPDALARRYPDAPTDWCGHWLFPATRLSRDPRSGLTRR